MKFIDLLSRVAVGIASGFIAAKVYSESQILGTVVLVVLILVGNLIVSMIMPSEDYH